MVSTKIPFGKTQYETNHSPHNFLPLDINIDSEHFRSSRKKKVLPQNPQVTATFTLAQVKSRMPNETLQLQCTLSVHVKPTMLSVTPRKPRWFLPWTDATSSFEIISCQQKIWCQVWTNVERPMPLAEFCLNQREWTQVKRFGVRPKAKVRAPTTKVMP